MEIVRKERKGKTHFAKIGAVIMFAAVCCFLGISYDYQPQFSE